MKHPIESSNKSPKEIITNLQKQVDQIEGYSNSMEVKSWGYEEGVLITGNDAKVIIEALKQTEKYRKGFFANKKRKL